MKFKKILIKKKRKRCQKVLVAGTEKNKFTEVQCKAVAYKDYEYCWQHSEQNKRKALSIRGISSSQLHKSMKLYMEKYAGNEWNSKNELAMLRSMMDRVAVNINGQSWKEVMHYLPKLALVGEQISRIGERHAKVSDGLKLKIEFNQLQAFVSFMVGVINKHCTDDEAKKTIASELAGYMERLEEDDE